MPIVKLVVAYDGTDFRGWAKQPGQRTVEGVLVDALTRLLQQEPKLAVAGRTDAGVHARANVASFDTDVDPGRLQRGLNGILSPEIVIREARAAPRGFDARHRATAREYRYRISAAPVPDPFTARFTWHHPGQLLLAPMRAAAQGLQGEHDFASFCRAPKLPASSVRNLQKLSVYRRGEELQISARANGFLHQMVRSLVGTVVAVGEGKIDPEQMPGILEARNRAAAGPVAPPHGLTLKRVIYGQ